VQHLKYWLSVLVLFGAANASAGSVLLISVDGLPPRYVTEAGRFALHIPHLSSFIERGSHASGVIAVTPTVTYPNHTTMVTGVWPAQHGITSNTTFDPLNVNRDGWYWYAEDIQVATLWSAASQAGLKTASINWPVSVGDRHIDVLLPEYWRTSTADDAKLLRALTRPEGLMARLEKKLGPFVDGNTDSLASDRVRTRYALEVLRSERPRFMGVHLVALDGTQHREGPETPAVFEVLEHIDGMVGELIAAARANDPATTIFLVSDHGFIATHTAVNLRTRFVEAGLISLGKSQPDTVPTITAWDAQLWPGGACAAVVLREPRDARLRQRVRRMLDEVAANTANGIARVLDIADTARSGAFPQADFLVEFAPGFYLGTAVRGELLTPGGSKGTHGYLPDRPEMQASLFIQGPDVAAGRDLGVVDLRRLAPTMARVLGVALPSASEPALDLASPGRR
jgi:predicted AlkP superfamily pyrophosphatase or phosphodiesterase